MVIITDTAQTSTSSIVANAIAGVALLLSIILFFLRFYDRSKNKNRFFADLIFSEHYKAFCEAHKLFIQMKYPKNKDVRNVVDAMNSFSKSFLTVENCNSRTGKRFQSVIERYEESVCVLINKKDKDDKESQLKIVNQRFHSIRKAVRKYL